METRCGKVSAPNAGESEHEQLKPQDKTQGNVASLRTFRLQRDYGTILCG